MVRGPRLPALLLLCLACCGGCKHVDYMAPERYQNGLVVILDGAGDITTAPSEIMGGLNDGGVSDAMETFRWSAGHNVITDQVDLARNRQKAAELADRLARYVHEFPGKPVHVIGLSAGTGIVVFAVEQLPADCPVDGVILLASSITANYDLAPAMQHVRNQITNFSSVGDLMILGVGVTLTGTVDRGHGVSAGIGGFHLPKDASDATAILYQEKLVEMPWQGSYVFYGHLGGHLGATSGAFVKKFMAPILIEDHWRRDTDKRLDAAMKSRRDSIAGPAADTDAQWRNRHADVGH